MKDFKFELGSLSFQGSFLEPEPSLDAFAIVSPVLADVIDSLDIAKLEKGAVNAEELIAPLTTSLRSFKDLKQLAPVFAECYEVKIPGNDSFVKLSIFYSEAFKGRPVEQVSFLVTCILKEFKDFLAQNGWSTLLQVAASCGFQIKPLATGPSGGSSTQKSPR